MKPYDDINDKVQSYETNFKIYRNIKFKYKISRLSRYYINRQKYRIKNTM